MDHAQTEMLANALNRIADAIGDLADEVREHAGPDQAIQQVADALHDIGDKVSKAIAGHP